MVQATFQWKHGSCRRSGQPGFLLWFRYDEDSIRRLKAMVPSWAREWNQDNHSWWVHKDFAEAVNDLFPGFLFGVQASRPLPGLELDEDPPEDDYYWNRW
jgi:hypothetical protein